MTNLTELQQKVIEQLGYDELDKEVAQTLKDISNYGIDGGYTGFIYYYETCKFFEDNKELIMTQLLEDRLNIDYSSLTEMLLSFNCFKGIDSYDIEQFLINPNDENNEYETTLKNGLAWYAAETVAYQLEEEMSTFTDITFYGILYSLIKDIDIIKTIVMIIEVTKIVIFIALVISIFSMSEKTDKIEDEQKEIINRLETLEYQTANINNNLKAILAELQSMNYNKQYNQWYQGDNYE